MVLTRMSGKIIQERLNDVTNVMKCIGHHLLKCSPNIFEAERELFVHECTPWTDKICLFLIGRRNVNLVVTRKIVYKGKHFAPSTFINDLINEGSGVVILRTSMIEIMVTDAKVDHALFRCHRYNI